MHMHTHNLFKNLERIVCGGNIQMGHTLIFRQMGSHATITHDTLDLTVQGTPSPLTPTLSSWWWHLVAKTGDLFNIVHLGAPPPCWHLVATKACSYGLQADGMLPTGMLSCYMLPETVKEQRFTHTWDCAFWAECAIIFMLAMVMSQWDALHVTPVHH